LGATSGVKAGQMGLVICVGNASYSLSIFFWF